ncbi:MAG: hypothetical protein Q8N23_05180 [Archangium sp.]|nr:hypothetical protein [Archangium sp.]MDP3152039.1 hypothetical protein [Archangium sp.]MDP3575475.1 hypothetical protein [Archangium sp.]
MQGEVAFERAVRADPTRVLQRVEKWLIGNGYEVAVRSNQELNLVGMTTSGRHRLSVRADGQSVRFVFAPGAPGVTLPSTSELERRVESSLQALTVTGSAPVSPAAEQGTQRCGICATVLEAGARVCPTCGMATG